MNRLKRLIIGAVLLVAIYVAYGFPRGIRFGLFRDACENGNPLLVALLLDLGSDPNGGGSDEEYATVPYELRNPLCLASEGGHLNVVRQLLQAGARPDVYEGEGISPLDYAIIEGHPDVAKALLEAGAPTGEHNGHLPLETARHFHRAEIVALLEQHELQ